MILRSPPSWITGPAKRILTPLAVALLSPLILMLWAASLFDRWMGPKRGSWQWWIAFKPVRRGYEPNGDLIWLEFVERTDLGGGRVLYRRPRDGAVVAEWENEIPRRT